MDESRPPVDFKVIEECRCEDDFGRSVYGEGFRTVDEMLNDLMKNE